ncbi:MAG: bis-aminopropyl spermidine synthase family protein [Candidatus Heimdallarchaeota archaeon]|nr:bis-aminopropyl spermidine synthase family protein [Candidatus Heimdallarchaeota archaeon]
MSNRPTSDESLTKFNEAFSSIEQIRGKPNKELDQYFVTKDTSLNRALLVNPDDYNHKRIITLGDMDLVALSIGLLSKPRDLAILDIDKRVSEIALNMKIDQNIRSVRFINHDIRTKMLGILNNQFDYVFIEPPMTEEGLEVGLSRAVQCAKKNEPSKIFLSFDIIDEKKHLIEEYFEKMNLTIESVKKSFNVYEHETPLEKSVSDLYVLAVSEESTETIPHHYFGPTYFRESYQKPHTYECKCGEIYSVGAKGSYSTIVELKEKGCPKCGYSENFRYTSSIPLE